MQPKPAHNIPDTTTNDIREDVEDILVSMLADSFTDEQVELAGYSHNYRAKMSMARELFDIDNTAHSIITLFNQRIIDELEEIVKGNYAPDLGTYDYDGIADSVFVHIESLRQEMRQKDGL